MRLIYALLIFLLLSQCRPSSRNQDANTAQPVDTIVKVQDSVNTVPRSKRIQVPILCYHQIEPGKPTDYRIHPDQFYAHIKMLSDSGYHAILPDQLFNYLDAGAPLPERPVMISFDDSHEEHYSIAAPVLRRFGFKAVFFIMTVTIGRPNYMTSDQIRSLSDSGHVIANHTWNHPNLNRSLGIDWDRQITQPNLVLEKITGRKIEYFAYPHGEKNDSVIQELKKRGIKLAFQLSKRQDEKETMYTVRRLLITGNMSPSILYKRMQGAFR